MRIAIAALLLAACGNFPLLGDGARGDDGGDGGGDDGPCVGLECHQVTCDGRTPTTVTGLVMMPNGLLPIYDALVYVPNPDVPPQPAPGSCRRCVDELPATALVSTRTDVAGRFSLGNMPATANVPLVIQTGQWRRTVNIPEVTACTEAALPEAMTRLPRNRTEGELPRFAITTGGADALECLIRKIGIDDSELGIAGSPASVHLFVGTAAQGASRFDTAHGGATFPAAATTLWNSAASLASYDVVVMSCEGQSVMHGAASHAAMRAYVDAGGRALADHWHDTWITLAPAPWPALVDFLPRPDLTPRNFVVDQTFPRGAAFAEWLVATGASTTLGQVPINDPQDTIVSIDPGARQWIYLDPSPNGGGPTIQHMSFTAPVEAAPDQRCGRFMFSDVHVASGDRSEPTLGYPSGGCTTSLSSLTPQEKALLYQLFELDRCVDASGT